MIRTRVGYAGGTTPDPTYRRIGDHSECIQVDFDPATITYQDLLGHFFTMHDPSRPAHSTQYASLVLHADESQRAQALAAAESFGSRFGRPVRTRIEPLTAFHLAEEYHQKYALKADPLLDSETRAQYPAPADYRDSTLAARLNGIVYGAAGAALANHEVESYGLSGSARAHLRALVR